MNRFIDYIVGAIVALVLFTIIAGTYSGITYFDQRIKDNAPIEEWFQVRQLYIQDMDAHVDPVIIYDRSIYKPFDTNWDVQVEKLTGTGVFVYCSGNGVAHPTPDKIIPAEGVTLSWLVGKSCDLTAGKYRVTVNWLIHREGYKDATYTVVSNVFEVS